MPSITDVRLTATCLMKTNHFVIYKCIFKNGSGEKKRHFKRIFCGKMVCLGTFRAQTQQPKQAEGHCEAQHSVFAAAHGWLIRKVLLSRIARCTGNGRTAANGPWPSSKALSIPKLVPRLVCLPPLARESQPPTSAAVSMRREGEIFLVLLAWGRRGGLPRAAAVLLNLARIW